ncbi:hypothetical protein [Olsenella sp. kh2p3]|uniref:hypothetical protein n=1 Tax=Olsenella sp. kh2p3 TaxID=1797112 RepID=UPI0009108593|nr:hypothetical protein [Olsenella sp. kh2p3]SFX20995.1 hypothetical protein SAMN04487823_10296 [Olsenella sp. kh2p3]
MGKETRAACEKILASAERRGLCASATNRDELNRFTYLRRKGELVSPYAGLFATADVWSRLLPSQRTRRVMRTLARLHPSWIFVGASAALIYDLAVPPSVMWPLCIATTGNGTCKTYAHARRKRVSACEVLVIDSMRTTSLDMAVVDCMRTLEFPSALAIADSYLRKTNQPKERLEAMVSPPQMGKPGIRNARLIASLADGRAESWGESEARAAMIELGFQMPDLQVPYQDPVTGKWYRADFSWNLGDAGTVIGEMDGLLKYTDSTITGGDALGVFVRERQRESRLTIGGRSVMRFTPAQVKDRPFFESLLESYGIPRVEPLAGWKALR